MVAAIVIGDPGRAALLSSSGDGDDDNEAGASAVGDVVVPLALAAAGGYLVAFQPPQFVQRLGQQSTTYDFIRRLNGLPQDGPIDDIWRLLAEFGASVDRGASSGRRDRERRRPGAPYPGRAVAGRLGCRGWR